MLRFIDTTALHAAVEMLGLPLAYRMRSSRFRSTTLCASPALASPRFLFVDEKPGKLDDLALATRLSLFLSNSLPDQRLRDLEIVSLAWPLSWTLHTPIAA